jgi:hypothetical protein
MEDVTPQQRKQIERDRQRPEFLEWLAAADTELATFLAEDVPGMPDNPYSEEGIQHAQTTARAYIAARDTRYIDLESRFRRFLGEVFVRCFEGDWLYVDVIGKGELRPVVLTPFNPLLLDPERQIDRLFGKDPDPLGSLFRFRATDYGDWLASGRLTGEAWEEYRYAVRRARRRASGEHE